MAFLNLLLGALISLGDVFKEIVRWFTKTPQQKVDEHAQQIDKERDKAKDDGRPTWNG